MSLVVVECWRCGKEHAVNDLPYGKYNYSYGYWAKTKPTKTELLGHHLVYLHNETVLFFFLRETVDGFIFSLGSGIVV